MNDEKETEWLHFLRSGELEVILKFFPQTVHLKILEIGGGDGYLAKCISNRGYDIISIDVKPGMPLDFPVEKMDGKKLNFPAETFDIVFTSHVLAHITDLENLFEEIKRILKKDGISIHIVPTTGWSIITNIWHYLLIPKAFSKFYNKNNKEQKTYDENINSVKNHSNKFWNHVKNYLFLHPLGTAPSFLHEFFYFSQKKWMDLFKKNNFKIINVKKGPYFYSGHGIFKMKLLSLREKFAKYICSSSYCFVMKRINN